MKRYRLEWSDEFDYEGLPDPQKWSYDVGARKWGNNEIQYYTEGLNASVKNSILTIEGRIEDYQDSPYTSCRLTTYQKRHFLYGRLEVAAKLPLAIGTWPAIWMLGVKHKEGVSWPLCGEIDLMEHVAHTPDQIHVSLHSELYNLFKYNQMTHVEVISGISDRFAVYAVEWDPDGIAFFVDGKPFGKFAKHADERDTSPRGWPFDEPFYLILNMAIGGSWGGPVKIEDYPARYEIDYVRYYSINEE